MKKNYILDCCEEADRRIAEELKTMKEKQFNCKCKNLSYAVHRGEGYYSQYC